MRNIAFITAAFLRKSLRSQSAGKKMSCSIDIVSIASAALTLSSFSLYFIARKHSASLLEKKNQLFFI